MDFFSLLGIAVALAMDAFAVALATGVSLKQVSPRQTFRLSWHFGLFQALMPIIGWSFGSSIDQHVAGFAHWIAFFLLALVGVNMIRESLCGGEDEKKQEKDNTRGATLVILSLATSIDALAVGLGLSLLNSSILTPALFIGLVAGVFTIIGLHLGKAASNVTKLSPIAELLGGCILLFIGLNILRQHGVFTFLSTLMSS